MVNFITHVESSALSHHSNMLHSVDFMIWLDYVKQGKFFKTSAMTWLHSKNYARSGSNSALLNEFRFSL